MGQPPHQNKPAGNVPPPDAGVSSFLDDVVSARLARVSRLYTPSDESPTAPQSSVVTKVAPSVATQAGGKKPPSSSGELTPMAELATHLANQFKAHQAVQRRTSAMFDVLLTQLEDSTADLRLQLAKVMQGLSFPGAEHQLPQVFASVDGDRSLGMAHILWHRLNFTIRSQTQPYAILHPENYQQVLCGRILALRGDFVELTEDNPLHEVPELLHAEVASLYIPAQGPCFVGLGSVGGGNITEGDPPLIVVDEAMVVEKFVQHCLLMVCTGDLLHEQLDDDFADFD